MLRAFLRSQSPRQAAPAASATPGTSSAPPEAQQQSAPSDAGFSAPRGQQRDVSLNAMAVQMRAMTAAAMLNLAHPGDYLSFWNPVFWRMTLRMSHAMMGGAGPAPQAVATPADLTVFDIDLSDACLRAYAAPSGPPEAAAAMNTVSTMQVMLRKTGHGAVPPPTLDLEPALWGKLPFEVKLLILREFLNGAGTRVLRQSEVRRQALVLAAEGYAELLPLARRHLWHRPDIVWPRDEALELSQSSHVALLIRHFNHPGLPRMEVIGELSALVNDCMGKYPNLRTLVIESFSERWPISVLVERAAGAGVTSLSFYGAALPFEMLFMVPGPDPPIFFSSSLATRWPNLERLSLTAWAADPIVFPLVMGQLAFILSDPPPKLRTIVLRLARHSELNATFGRDNAREESYVALVAFACRQNQSPLHLRPGVKASLQMLLRRRSSRVAGRHPKIYIADLVGADERLPHSQMTRRLAKSDQRWLATGDLGVWAFSEHANAALPDPACDKICASVLLEHGGELRLINDSSASDSWAALDGLDECQCPDTTTNCPPRDLATAVKRGSAESWRCIPTLSGRRRHIRTVTRIHASLDSRPRVLSRYGPLALSLLIYVAGHLALYTFTKRAVERSVNV